MPFVGTCQLSLILYLHILCSQKYEESKNKWVPYSEHAAMSSLFRIKPAKKINLPKHLCPFVITNYKQKNRTKKWPNKYLHDLQILSNSVHLQKQMADKTAISVKD